MNDAQFAQMQNRLNRLAIELGHVSAGDYPTPQHLTYIAELGSTRAVFMTDERYSHGWFYPRYANGALHEPITTRMLFDSLTPQSVFVDVGAHLGYFSIIAALKARAVFAIEPQEFLIGRIHRNVSANHLRNVTLMHAAVGSAPGFANIPKIGSPMTEVGHSDNRVPMVRLDDYFTGDDVPTHIKIDTEGFEYHVLNGARRILQTRPTLFIEHHKGMHKFGPGSAEMWQLLADHGYTLHLCNHRDSKARPEPVAKDVLGTLNNVMLICQPA